MKLPTMIIAALTTMLLLSGCIFPGGYWGGRHHDHGGDEREGGDHSHHDGDHGDHGDH